MRPSSLRTLFSRRAQRHRRCTPKTEGLHCEPISLAFHRQWRVHGRERLRFVFRKASLHPFIALKFAARRGCRHFIAARPMTGVQVLSAFAASIRLRWLSDGLGPQSSWCCSSHASCVIMIQAKNTIRSAPARTGRDRRAGTVAVP